MVSARLEAGPSGAIETGSSPGLLDDVVEGESQSADTPTLIIGTRGSRLALEQARRVEAGLAGPSEVRVVRTSGDRFKDQPLGDANPVGFFTKEIESAALVVPEVAEAAVVPVAHEIKGKEPEKTGICKTRPWILCFGRGGEPHGFQEKGFPSGTARCRGASIPARDHRKVR